jgi:LacI family transcriptional regulator
VKILVSVFLDVRWGRSFVRGVAEFGALREPGWVVFPRSPGEGFPAVFAAGEWDGVIVQVTDEASVEVIRTASCPVVLVDPRPEILPELPRILFDHAAVGRVAAKHLLETGRRHFAFFGFDRAKLSEEREEAFRAAVSQAGFGCGVTRIPIELDHHRTRVGSASREVMRAALAGLPRPVAIACGNDELSRVLLELCLDAGYRVPEEVALIGGDDDDLFCRTSRPSLSSVSLPFTEAGQMAAELLQRRIEGGEDPPRVTMIGPSEVAARDSTRVVPGEDRAIEAAVREFHLRIADPKLRIVEVAAAVNLSVSSLERRFQAALGCTPLVKLRDLRVTLAKRLLGETDLAVTEVARTCGFGGASRFGVAFREMTGLSPLAYRRDASRQTQRKATVDPAEAPGCFGH